MTEENKIRYYQYRAELLRVLFSDIDTIIDYDYKALFDMKEAIMKSEEEGVSLRRQRPSSGFRNVNKSDIN